MDDKLFSPPDTPLFDKAENYLEVPTQMCNGMSGLLCCDTVESAILSGKKVRTPLPQYKETPGMIELLVCGERMTVQI